MRRRVSRLVGALTALWSLALSGGPVALHHCPMHSLPAAAATAAARHAMSDDMSEAMPGMHHGDHEGSDQDPSAPQQHKGCCCPDGGCTSTPVALTTVALALPGQLVHADERVFAPSVDRVRPTRADLALPHSNAPPTT